MSRDVAPVRVMHWCSESTVDGTAPYLHASAIAEGLAQDRSLTVRTVWRPPGANGRLWDLVRHQVRALRSLRTADVVYARWHVLDLPLHMVAKLANVRVVLEVNGRTDDLLIAYPRFRAAVCVFRWMAAASFRRADHIIAVSPGLAQWVSEISGQHQVSWVGNGAPTDLALCHAPPAEPPVVLFIGALSAWQGIDLLCEAVRSSRWPAGCVLHIIGSGPMQAEVEAAAREGVVRFHGRLPRAEAMRHLARARVSVSPQGAAVSRNHVMGMPFKVLESLMLGVPVVGSALPQQQEMLSAAPGCFAFDGYDGQALADAVEMALRTDLRTREQLREFAVQHASWEAAVVHAREVVTGLGQLRQRFPSKTSTENPHGS